jgi:hypothetical protein
LKAGKKMEITAAKSGKIKVTDNLRLQGDEIHLN